MRPTFRHAVIACTTFFTVLLAGAEAQAQFANSSIGLEGGGVWVANKGDLAVGNGFILPELTYSYYLENGFEFTSRVGVMWHKGRLEDLTQGNIVGLSVGPGFRYLLSEEAFRPYVGLGAMFGYFFNADASIGVTVAPNLGFEYFLSDTYSLGLQVEYRAIITTVQHLPESGFGGVVRFAWYF